MSAQMNERQTQIVLIPVGSLATDNTQVPGFTAPRKMRVVSVKLLNGATIAASDTDYAQVSLKNGSNVVAELDTRAAHENGLTANVGKALNLDSTYRDLAEGDSVHVDYQEAGTMALTNAVLQVEVYQIGKNS